MSSFVATGNRNCKKVVRSSSSESLKTLDHNVSDNYCFGLFQFSPIHKHIDYQGLSDNTYYEVSMRMVYFSVRLNGRQRVNLQCGLLYSRVMGVKMRMKRKKFSLFHPLDLQLTQIRHRYFLHYKLIILDRCLFIIHLPHYRVNDPQFLTFCAHLMKRK